MLYLESLNNALHDMMSKDSQVVLIGEDLLDPYGGAFKVSKGLSTAFPKQVISTPISEQSITGAAVGMAMWGMKPIVEIMFGDFLTLCVDQIVNHATKYHWMFNEKTNVPVVIRTPMGGGRGYGPTHSQSIESMFMSVSGIVICAPSIFHDPGKLLTQAVTNEKHPVLFIENKALYPEKLQQEKVNIKSHFNRQVLANSGLSETLLISLYPEEKADMVVITYGAMASVAVDAAWDLYLNEEILIHIVVVSKLRPVPIDDCLPLVRSTRKVLVLEEGNEIGGWGAEVAAQIHGKVFEDLSQPVFRMGAADTPIPSALPLEKETLPTTNKLVGYITNLMNRV